MIKNKIKKNLNTIINLNKEKILLDNNNKTLISFYFK